MREQDELQNMHEADGIKKINDLEQKIDTTKYNIEVSKEIISETPSDTERQRLTEKNTQRQHAIGSMQKEIKDIEQTMEERSCEL